MPTTQAPASSGSALPTAQAHVGSDSAMPDAPTVDHTTAILQMTEGRFKYGPFKGERFADVAVSKQPEHVSWRTMLLAKSPKDMALYQKQFVAYLETLGVVEDEEYERTGECRHVWKTTKGSNGYEGKLLCIKCGARKASRNDEVPAAR